MLSCLQKSLILLGLCVLSSCGSNSSNTPSSVPSASLASSSASSSSAPSAEPNPRIEHRVITSAITGISYPLHIYLPADYGLSDKTYPVIYATDGQWIFQGFADAIDQQAIDVILVAIEQGPNDRRSVDYLLPGARRYFSFLTTELLPDMERDYRIDSSRRILSGTSYGGVLVGAALLLDDPVAPHFAYYLCFDASFYVHPEASRQLMTERYNASQILAANLVLTSATTIGNDIHVSQFQQQLQQLNFTGLDILRKKYPVHHNDVAQPSFEDSLRHITIF